jgi:glycosyltransferase involved in cell wall biosynthesis
VIEAARQAGVAVRRTVVVSAVNLVEGGTLTILRQCLASLRAGLDAGWRIVALVHDRGLAPVDGVDYLEFPAIKSSYLRRLLFEYVACRRLSRALDADLWIALHDLTPVVHARRQVVYCHNPMPFHRLSWREARLTPALVPFALFQGLLYGVNIRRNAAVVVQQDWLRDAFKRRYGVERVIVARPVPAVSAVAPRPVSPAPLLIYPTLPRPFKNVEVIGEALRLLEAEGGWRGRVRVTIAGDENAYARDLRRRYGGLASLEFVGLQTREQMAAQYAQADALVFPSRLETWGLPLTEAQQHGLAILVADLPYARETMGDYARAAWFDPTDAAALAALLRALQDGRLAFEPAARRPVAAPFAADWPALVALLTEGL